MAVPRVWGNRYLIHVDDIPLFGHIAFGVIDRGTNVLQVRSTTICPFNCVYCSVDAGPYSARRQSEFIVDADWLVEWVRLAYKLKRGEVLEALLDGVGEPATHPSLPKLVGELKKIVPRVALETRGFLLTKDLITRLWEAGLDRLNVSIDTLEDEKARYLTGVRWFNVGRVKEVVEYTIRETGIDVMLTPVWIPGVNDEDVAEIVEWGLRVGVGRRFPGFGIQKYEVHKHGRKIPGVREPSWAEFYKFIRGLEEKYGVVLDYRKLDMGFRKASRIPIVFGKNDRVELNVKLPGWLKNEVIAVDEENRVVVTIVGVRDFSERRVKARIISNEDGIYIARLVE